MGSKSVGVVGWSAPRRRWPTRPTAPHESVSETCGSTRRTYSTEPSHIAKTEEAAVIVCDEAAVVARRAAVGCFLLGTAITEANRDPEVRAIVDDTMASFTATFAERFERAERDGELFRTRPARSHKSPRRR